jgi:hypothetical protein
MFVTSDPRVAAQHLMLIGEAMVRGAGKGLLRAALLMQNEAVRIIRAERMATGQLSQSIHSELLPPQGTQLTAMVVAGQPYGPFVEVDTRPHVAPFAAFMPWAVAKVGRGAEGPPEVLARRAWAAVAAHGTKGIHFFERSYQMHRAQVPALVRDGMKEALAPYAR